MSRPASGSPRQVSLALSGYLCGTAPRARLLRPRSATSAAGIVAAHRELVPPIGSDGQGLMLGEIAWTPSEEAVPLRGRLLALLDHPEVIELIVLGRYAGAAPTGFDELDAVLVITDVAAEDPRLLRALRRRLLRALRFVIAHQPMQQHGFQVVTPKLLLAADEALGMPPARLVRNRSLRGNAVAAHFSSPDAARAAARLAEAVDAVVAVEAWPRRARAVHALVSALRQLAPLYRQAGAELTDDPEWESRDVVLEALERPSGPYRTLIEVRSRWPRMRARGLRASATVLRNPWRALAVWSLLPRRVPEPPRSLLTPELLAELKQVARSMAEATESRRGASRVPER